MNWIFTSLLTLLCLSVPGSVIIVSGQGKLTDLKVLEGGDDWQCSSVEERERARNTIHQIVASVITTTLPTATASATTESTTDSTTTMTDCSRPGWKRVHQHD